MPQAWLVGEQDLKPNLGKTKLDSSRPGPTHMQGATRRCTSLDRRDPPHKHTSTVKVRWHAALPAMRGAHAWSMAIHAWSTMDCGHGGTREHAWHAGIGSTHAPIHARRLCSGFSMVYELGTLF